MECIIVSGCTSGLGLAIHQLMVAKIKEPACLFIGRNLERIKQSSLHCYLDLDLSNGIDPNIVELLPGEGVTGVTFISNAGTIDPVCQTKKIDVNEFMVATAVNFTSPAILASLLAAWAGEQGVPFRILNVTSGAANKPIEGWASYCSTKASIKLFLDVLALEGENVEVIHFDPGVIDTAMQASIRELSSTVFPSINSFVELKKNKILKSPEDVAINILALLGIK